MQDIERFRKADGIDRPICVAVEIFHDLEDRTATKSLKRLGVERFIAKLRFVKRIADALANGKWKVGQALLAGPDEKARP